MWCPWCGGSGMMGGGWLGGLLFLLFGLFVLIGIVLLVVWAARSFGSGQSQHEYRQPYGGGDDEAMAIARRRYANGELTKEQYDDLVRSLRA